MNTLYDDVRGAFYSIWQRRWLALGTAWAICLLGWLGVAMVPNSYESHARIFVQVYDPLSAQVGIGEAQRKHEMDRVRDTLTSSAHLEQVIRSTPLGENITSKRQMESAVQALGKAIKITSDQDNLFQISATSNVMRLGDSGNARLAKTIVEKMIQIFHDENLVGNRNDIAKTMQFLDAQLAQRQQQLQSAEARRLEFESKYPEAAGGGGSMVQRLAAIRAELRTVTADIAAAQSSLASINGQISSTPQTLAMGGSGYAGGARGALATAQAELAGMKARGLTDQHPDVIALRNQIASLKGQVQSEGAAGVVSGTPNPAYGSLVSIRADKQAAMQSLLARKAALDGDLARVTGAQTANPQIVAEAQNISRDYDVLKAQYDKLLADREQLKLQGSVEFSHDTNKFQVIDPPTSPRSPSAPNRPVLLFVVLLVGVASGVGVGYAAGELRSSFGTTGKLERATGLPVLGAISQSLTEAGQALKDRKLRYFYAASASLGGLFAVLLAVEFIQRGLIA